MSTLDRFVTYGELMELKDSLQTEIINLRLDLNQLKADVSQLRIEFLEFKEFASTCFDRIFKELEMLREEYVLMNHAIRRLEEGAQRQEKRWERQEQVNQETRDAILRIEASLGEIKEYLKKN